MEACFEFTTFVFQAFGDDCQAEIEKMATQITKGELRWLAHQRITRGNQAREIHRKRDLQWGMLAQISHGQFVRGFALEFEHDADLIRRFVSYVCDLGNLAASDQLSNLFDQLRFIDRVGKRSNDYLLFAAWQRLDLPLSP